MNDELNMSKFRENLETAQSEYHQTRYRGDLAADVLGSAVTSAHNPWKRRAGYITAAAVAAIVATVATVTFRSDSTPVAEKTTTSDDISMPTPEGVASNDAATPSNDQGQVAVVDPTIGGDPAEPTVQESFTVVPDTASTSDAETEAVASSFVPSYVAMSFSVPSSLGLGSVDEYEQQRLEQQQNQGDTPGGSSDNTSQEQL